MPDILTTVGAVTPWADMTLTRGMKHAIDEPTKDILYELARRIAAIKPWQDRLRTWCDRADALYLAEEFTTGGADLWPDDESAKVNGRIHISVNLPAVYVDVPAALQAVQPIENMLATDTTKAARTSAAALERLYSAWKREEDFDLKFHKAITVKSLYGQTAARLYWDALAEDGKGRVCLDIVEQPKNLWLGFKNDNYEEVEWAAYVTRWEPNALSGEFGVDVTRHTEENGTTVPLVSSRNWDSDTATRPYLALGDERIEVWDYWYRKPVWSTATGKLLRMETFNVVIAGNLIIRGPIKYDEYKGMLPYVPLFNTFIPGYPGGRPDLLDVEPLIREKMERITSGGQMIANGVAGDYWQLVGPDAMKVPAGLKPVRNEVVAPGPGNRIETITPFIAQFQLEQYLGRIDRELAAVSGLNDLLLGLAPAQVLSSSKAINALIANYESRLSIRRRILYKWRRNVWERVVKMWGNKDKRVQTIIKNGAGYLDIIDPSLSPRDEMETATRASNLVSAKLWSQQRGMDAVGVEDPETEMDLIREESTDATLWPERVQLMAQLLGALQSLGLNAPANAQGQAEGQMASGQNDLRKALGGGTAANMAGGPGPGGDPAVEGQTPAIPGAAPEAGGPPLPFASGPDQPPVMQSMVQNGKVSGRILSQKKLGRR